MLVGLLGELLLLLVLPECLGHLVRQVQIVYCLLIDSVGRPKSIANGGLRYVAVRLGKHGYLSQIVAIEWRQFAVRRHLVHLGLLHELRL